MLQQVHAGKCMDLSLGDDLMILVYAREGRGRGDWCL